jgi:protein phosphatase
MELSIPEVALVVLVGTTGSGKSTFAAAHFKSTAVLSSDAYRGLVSDDDTDQSATQDAFDLLHHVAGIRLRRGLLTVIDATNVQPRSRESLVKVARAHDVLPVAIVLDIPEHVCRERNATRPDRAGLSPHVLTRQRKEMRSKLRDLEREGFRKVHCLRSVADVENAQITYEKAYNDEREMTGPFDVIGDVHGCRAELETLLARLGYELIRDEQGRPIDARPPADRTALFVGDLVDRGPDTPGVLRLVMGMVGAGHALCVSGNHENKLVRALDGRKVQLKHGIVESLEQMGRQPAEFRAAATEFCRKLISHYVLDEGRLVIAHAGLKENYQGRDSGRVRSFAMYGETTGETDEYGLPVRYPWAEEYRGRAMVLYGHTPVQSPVWINNTMCLDTGCVFGGKLTALRYPERELVQVPAEKMWYAPSKPLAAGTTGHEHGVDRLGVLNLDDVLGRRGVETRLMGRLVVREENAAAALEVVSRFAVDPRWLPYLPPTMAPCATSAREDYLEYPTEAFEYFAGQGVAKVVCEEKHMGSRAGVLVARDADAARERFAVADGSTGVCVTRTGRPFFAPGPVSMSSPGSVSSADSNGADLTEALLARVRDAADKAGLWDELATDWLLLDAELLPWSAKAMGLLRDQYAAVGAAARTGLSASVQVLTAAAARGLEVTEPLARHTARLASAHAFTAAYGRYCWPTEGLDAVRLAPFQLLAAEGTVYAGRDHGWHLDVLDRLCAQDPEFLTRTGRRIVELDDHGQVAEAERWWCEMTAAGGEGMVVKPFEALVHQGRRLVQPGVKCRGPEYLRIIYGPDYLEPANLARLRKRFLGRKQSLALREYALGLEALERFVAREPLYRVHEAVFAVLALESEPVDPRL